MTIPRQPKHRPRVVLRASVAILVAGVLAAACSAAGSTDSSFDSPNEEDYRAAVLAMTTCLDQAGIRYSGPHEVGDLLVVRPLDTDGQPVEVAPNGYVRCRAEHLDAIEESYVARLSPSTEELDAAHESWLECLRDAGYEIPPNPPPSVVDGILKDAPLSLLAGCTGPADTSN